MSANQIKTWLWWRRQVDGSWLSANGRWRVSKIRDHRWRLHLDDKHIANMERPCEDFLTRRGAMDWADELHYKIGY